MLLLTLKHDDIGISTILRERMERCDEHFARLNAVRSEIPDRQVELSQLKSLQDRLKYATHVGDVPMADATLYETIAIEEAKLQDIFESKRCQKPARDDFDSPQARWGRLV